jgi:hypothetical protein
MMSTNANENLHEFDIDELIDDEMDEEVEAPAQIDPDEFFSNHAFRIIYQTNNFLIPQLKDLIKDGSVLNIRPEYQRRLRWTNPQKSKLIESLLLNIPVPPVFFFEAEEARYEVMDGQQRLNAIKEFLEGDFALSTLTVLKPLNGLRYNRLPPRVKRALDRSSLSAIILLAESEKDKVNAGDGREIDIRRFIFDRLNTGGRKLNAQELRNAIYPGSFNRAIVEMARDNVFTKTFGIPPYTEAEPNDYYENPRRQKNSLYATMGDCALVLRFFALRDEANIRGSMKSMLDRAMENRVALTDEQATEAAEAFRDRFQCAVNVFGPEPFLLPPDEKGRRRMSAGLYDSAMIAIDRNWEHNERFVERSNDIKAELEEKLSDDDTLNDLTGKTSTAQAVKRRIELMDSILKAGAGLN